MDNMNDIISDIEKELINMWSLGEAKNVLNDDPQLIKVMLIAIFYERTHFTDLGLVVGEAWQYDKRTLGHFVVNPSSCDIMTGAHTEIYFEPGFVSYEIWHFKGIIMIKNKKRIYLFKHLEDKRIGYFRHMFEAIRISLALLVHAFLPNVLTDYASRKLSDD